MSAIEGKKLIDLAASFNETAVFVDIWRKDDDVAITISDKDGRVKAGCSITLEQWLECVNYIAKQFGMYVTTGMDQ